MTAADAFELTTGGGATDFERIIRVCERSAPYCLIGGMAVNSYVEPVYLLDAGLVVHAEGMLAAEGTLLAEGLTIHWQEHTVNVRAPESQLRV